MNKRKFDLTEVLKESQLTPLRLVLFAAVLLLLPVVLQRPFERNMCILILMWACLGSAWNIFGGYTGQVCLGSAMFFGMGAYGVAIPYYYWKISPWLGILFGVVLALILALLVAVPIFRLSAQYFSIATMALGEAIRYIAINLPFTRGMQGLDFLDMKSNFWYSLQSQSKLPYYYMFVIIFAFVIGLMIWINSSKMGLYFRAIKANPDSAGSIGINVRKYKTYALLLCALIASLCGSVYVLYQTYVDPSTVLTTTISTKMIIMAVIGGTGTMSGPMVGALILVPLSEYIRAINSGRLPGIDLVIYGVLIILIIIYKPDGVVSILRSIKDKILGKKSVQNVKESV